MTRASLIACFLVACGMPPEPGEPDDTALEPEAIFATPLPCVGYHFQVRPRETSAPGGPIIGNHGELWPGDGGDTYRPNRDHHVYRGRYGNPCTVPASPRLVVFLPGHTQRPSDFPEFLGTAVAQGYHVIGLDYPNPTPLYSVCANASLSCYGNVREEIVYGTSGWGGAVDVDQHPQDAIVPRLVRLLIYLAETKDPSGDWDTFLSFDGVRYHVRWDRVVIAGHGGYEALIGAREAVSRVVMLGTVSDASGTTFSNAISAPSRRSSSRSAQSTIRRSRLKIRTWSRRPAIQPISSCARTTRTSTTVLR